jgi:hypothetical protein
MEWLSLVWPCCKNRVSSMNESMGFLTFDVLPKFFGFLERKPSE